MRRKYIPMPELSHAQKSRFWESVSVRQIDECWNWRGRVVRGSSGDYGKFSANGTYYVAHRVALFLATDVDPEELDVCHSCDNTLCCNPAHLWIGDARSNILDAVAKGRHARCKGNAKITQEVADEIRSYFSPRVRTRKMAAKKFGVSVYLVDEVLYGGAWVKSE